MRHASSGGDNDETVGTGSIDVGMDGVTSSGRDAAMIASSWYRDGMGDGWVRNDAQRLQGVSAQVSLLDGGMDDGLGSDLMGGRMHTRECMDWQGRDVCATRQQGHIVLDGEVQEDAEHASLLQDCGMLGFDLMGRRYDENGVEMKRANFGDACMGPCGDGLGMSELRHASRSCVRSAATCTASVCR